MEIACECGIGPPGFISHEGSLLDVIRDMVISFILLGDLSAFCYMTRQAYVSIQTESELLKWLQASKQQMWGYAKISA